MNKQQKFTSNLRCLGINYFRNSEIQRPNAHIDVLHGSRGGTGGAVVVMPKEIYGINCFNSSPLQINARDLSPFPYLLILSSELFKLITKWTSQKLRFKALGKSGKEKHRTNISVKS